MITREEVSDIVSYLNKYEKNIIFDLNINKDGYLEVEYRSKIISVGEEKVCLIKFLNKKTYKNSNNKEFDVYTIEEYIEGECSSLINVIKIKMDSFIGVKTTETTEQYIIFDKDGYCVITENEVEIFNEEIGKKTKSELEDIVIEICKDNDILLKRRLKNLVNLYKKEYSYRYIFKVFKNLKA